MSTAIRLPEINGATTQEQVAQIRSYLYMFADQLNWAMNTIEKGNKEAIVVQNSSSLSPAEEADKAVQSFNEVKALIIKSADIITAYYEQIDNLISASGKYTAESDFGVYKQLTDMRVSANSESITQHYISIEDITSRVESIEDATRIQEGYIKTGNVGSYWDSNALGMEIGEYDTENNTTEKRYSRFTSYGVELFGDDLTIPVAYIKQDKLYITNAEVAGILKIGGYEIDTSDGLSFRWVGRS